MKCSKCGFENVDSAKYCINCGARMDGNIVCPKCGEVISPDSDFCPKCGRKIPHNSQEEVNEAKLGKKKRLTNIFSLVSTILILVTLALSLLAVWGKYITVNKPSVPNYHGYSFYYLAFGWGEMKNMLDATSDVYTQSSIIFSTVLSFILILFNIVITYVFGIKGIINCTKNLAKRTYKCESFVNLAVVLASNFFASRMLGSSIFFADGTQHAYSIASINTFIAIACCVLVSVSILSIIASFNSKHFSLFIERLIFLSSFILMLVMLSSFNGKIALSTYSMYSTSTALDLFSKFEAFKADENFITAFVISCSLVIFKFVAYIGLGTLIIFYVTGFFSNKEYSMRYKIPCYALSLMLLISTLIMMVLNVLFVIFINKVPYFFGSEDYKASLELTIWGQTALAVIIFGCAIASLSLSRSYNHNQRLAEKTTVK